MLPLSLQPEPSYFDTDIRQKGNHWLTKHPTAKPSKYPAYWRNCLDDLHHLYEGICAYYCIYVDLAQGAATVDHFLPKSIDKQSVYEWKNYRFASLAANRTKKHNEVYDPFLLPRDYPIFYIDFSNGEVYLAPNLSSTEQEKAEMTITHLKLNSKRLCEMRMHHFSCYLKNEFTSEYLKKQSPFVWAELNRQAYL